MKMFILCIILAATANTCAFAQTRTTVITSDSMLLASIDSALIARPSEAVLHCQRGDVMFKNERYGDAFTSYDRAVSLDPKMRIAYEQRLFCRLHLKDYFGATKEITTLSVMK